MIWAVTVMVLPQVGSVGVTARVVPTRFAGVGAWIKTAPCRTEDRGLRCYGNCFRRPCVPG